MSSTNFMTHYTTKTKTTNTKFIEKAMVGASQVERGKQFVLTAACTAKHSCSQNQ
ncbi:6667_t:CDS:2 [Funneliformis caledonium]|uniref:6667_t:CDS:1 n=2 Tax=Funneliformis TaxID=1117308 RepID=A0A9N8WEP1_9GLOM|nr:6667_t:CDS:2 [Funneliformis caledonium]CAG8519283.1 2552_t:CDS:2 [Funneliformis mosseae]